jgi:hypothetical protein
VRVALIVVCLLGCGATPKQRERRAELAIGGSLVGMIASALTMAALPSQKQILIPITIGFGALAVGSAVAYGIAHAQVVSEPAGPPPKPNPPWALTQQAQAAARADRCDEVRELGIKVKALDEDFHAVVFARDVAIQRCMSAPKAKPKKKR